MKEILDNGAVIEDSSIDNSSVLYKDTRVTSSVIGPKSTIGDNTIFFKSILEGYNAIERYDYITDSFVGFGTYIGRNAHIIHTQIGKFCSLSWHLSIGGNNHKYRNVSSFPEYHFNRVLDDKREILKNEFADTVIGNDVWIGSGANVLRGVNVSDGTVIGGGCVVTRDTLPFSIVVGVPARIIGFRFEDEIIKKMLELKWWNKSLEWIREHRAILTSTPNLDILDSLIEEGKTDEVN